MKYQDALPCRRAGDLVVKALESETLVYDPKTHHAFCLNQSSALIWNLCDGKTSVAEIARRAAAQLELPIDETFVSFALQGLSKDGLLTRPYAAPVSLAGVTRLDLIKRVGRAGIVAAAAIPLVTAVIAPTAAKAYGKGDGGGGWGFGRHHR